MKKLFSSPRSVQLHASSTMALDVSAKKSDPDIDFINVNEGEHLSLRTQEMINVINAVIPSLSKSLVVRHQNSAQ